jgi:hypothetical protein
VPDVCIVRRSWPRPVPHGSQRLLSSGCLPFLPSLVITKSTPHVSTTFEAVKSLGAVHSKTTGATYLIRGSLKGVVECRQVGNGRLHFIS